MRTTGIIIPFRALYLSQGIAELCAGLKVGDEPGFILLALRLVLHQKPEQKIQRFTYASFCLHYFCKKNGYRTFFVNKNHVSMLILCLCAFRLSLTYSVSPGVTLIFIVKRFYPTSRLRKLKI